MRNHGEWLLHILNEKYKIEEADQLRTEENYKEDKLEWIPVSILRKASTKEYLRRASSGKSTKNTYAIRKSSSVLTTWYDAEEKFSKN